MKKGVSSGFLGLALLMLAGCAASPAYRDAGPRMSQFQELETEPRIRYEPGAREYAEQLAPLLPQAIAEVEAKHYRPFARPVRVYICGTPECFAGYVPEPTNLTAAVVYDNRLLLHPRLFTREPQRLAPILLHELSHLHLGQQIGHYSATVPVWFHEGLASLVADGGGADLATEQEATTAILAGEHFEPDAKHDPASRKNADEWGLPVSVFYRQSMMFVEHLKSIDEEKFRQLLLAVEDGENFDSAFEDAFGADPRTVANRFFEQIRCAATIC